MAKEKINETEGRAVLHVALRAPKEEFSMGQCWGGNDICRFAKTLAPEVDLQLELFLFGEVSQVSCAVLHTHIFDLLVSKNKEYLLSYARSQQLKASPLRVSRALLRFQDYTQKAFKDMQLSLKV